MGWILLLVFLAILVLIITSGPGLASNAVSKQGKPNLSKAELNQRNEKRNRFIELYTESNWQAITDEFEGYNFTLDNNEYDDYQAMAQAWINMGDESKAHAYMERVLESAYGVRKSEAFLNMAIFYMDLNKFDKAIEMILNSTPNTLRNEKQWSQFYRAMRLGAECFMNLGMIDEGIAFLKQAPITARIIDKDLADVLEWLGEFYEKKGYYDKAQKSYQKVVTVRFDKELNKKILDLNQLIYENEQEKDRKKMSQRRKKGDDFFD
jgi:tetratricopeptide (TPR) repeat protein